MSYNIKYKLCSTKLKISENDTSAEYLASKLIGSGLLDVTVGNSGGDESIILSINLDDYASAALSLDGAYNNGNFITVDSDAVELNASGSNALDMDGYLSLNEISSPSAGLVDKGLLYSKDADGYTELYYMDNYGNEIKITDKGGFVLN